MAGESAHPKWVVPATDLVDLTPEKARELIPTGSSPRISIMALLTEITFPPISQRKMPSAAL